MTNKVNNRLSAEEWRNIFRNLKENDEEVEIVWLDEVGGPGEWCLCCDCEMFESGFDTEKEATQRLEHLLHTV